MDYCIVYNPASIDSVIAAAFLSANLPGPSAKVQSGNLTRHNQHEIYYWVGVKPNMEIFETFKDKVHCGFFTGGTKKGRFFKSEEEKLAKAFDSYLTWENSQSEIQIEAGYSGFEDVLSAPETLMALVTFFLARVEQAEGLGKNLSFWQKGFGIATYIYDYETLDQMEIERQDVLYANYALAVQSLEQDPVLTLVSDKDWVHYEPVFHGDHTGYMEMLAKVKRAISNTVEYRSITIDHKPLRMPVVNLPPEQSPFAARLLSSTFSFGLVYDNRRGKTVFMPFSRIAGFKNAIMAGMEKALLNEQKTPQLYCEF